ncbi:MAG TPA: hypothetical protein VJ799_01965 [Nitrososphaeraceae archaeon]|nr:hypothetical protein [Nitrososphaeraceae archaeon]
MSTSQQETTTSMAIIAILAATALFGGLVLTVVTIPLQQAEAAQESHGCDKKSNGAKQSGKNCYHRD